MLSAAKLQDHTEERPLPTLSGARKPFASGDSGPLRVNRLPEHDKPTAVQRPAVGTARFYSLFWQVFQAASPGITLGFGYSAVSFITGCFTRLRSTIRPLAAAWSRRA